jgi:hypothetical protein
MKINKNLVTFIKSTSVVLVISTLIGLSVKLFNGSFWASFILSTGLQYILFTLFANIVNNYFIQQTRQKELDKLEQLSTILGCAYCQQPEVVTFMPDENKRIEFVCNKCDGKNVVNINFTVARVTEPLTVAPSLQNQVVTPIES